MSSLASEKKPSSSPSPTYQCTNPLLAYSKSNLQLTRAKMVSMRMLLASMFPEIEHFSYPVLFWARHCLPLAVTRRPVGTQSTNFTVPDSFTELAALTAQLQEIASPLSMRQAAMYFLLMPLMSIAKLSKSKSSWQTRPTSSRAYWPQPTLLNSLQEEVMKWILGQGTKLVSRSRNERVGAVEGGEKLDGGKRRLRVMLEAVWAIRWLMFEYVGISISSWFQAMPYSLSLVKGMQMSECSSRLWPDRTVLQGSTGLLLYFSEGQTSRLILVFFMKSTDILSMMRSVRPLPVPPLTECVMTKPSRLSIFSTCFLIPSIICSSKVLPSVQCPRMQLLAASSFPAIWLPGLYRPPYLEVFTSSITIGSKSMCRARGVSFPEVASLKIGAGFPDYYWPEGASRPSGEIPCSRQNSSQQELATWMPHCPKWRKSTSFILLALQYKI